MATIIARQNGQAVVSFEWDNARGIGHVIDVRRNTFAGTVVAREGGYEFRASDAYACHDSTAARYSVADDGIVTSWQPNLADIVRCCFMPHSAEHSAFTSVRCA